jgi:hypothetical protein
MVDLESQEEDDPNRILIFKRMSCLGKIVGAQIYPVYQCESCRFLTFRF